MAVAALVLYGVYFALAVVLRVLLQWHRTRDTGLRRPSGPPGSRAWWAGVLFVAALPVGALGPVTALGGDDPLPALTHPVLQAGGTVLAVAGIAATLVAQLRMGASWRIGVDDHERTDLVTCGVFALVRNPIFTAVTAAGLGLALMVPNAVALAGWLLLLVAVQVQVRAVEEPYLRGVHGAAYDGYAASTGRFVPGMGRVRRGPPTGGGSPVTKP
jgi:protein-S-isoprenylcysteine O-methyltransferase Ste14